MLHELGHNLGAVQKSAPHTTGAFHCIDGLDIKCYDDGLNGASYSASVCSGEDFDCNNDDYFHVYPAAGSHLEDHWNIGSRLNNDIEFDRPRVPPTVC